MLFVLSVVNLCVLAVNLYPKKKIARSSLSFGRRVCANNEFVLRQVLLPVPTPVGRIIIIVIIIEDGVNQHARYYSTGLTIWGIFLTAKRYSGISAMHSISTSASSGFWRIAIVERAGVCPSKMRA